LQNQKEIQRKVKLLMKYSFLILFKYIMYIYK